MIIFYVYLFLARADWIKMQLSSHYFIYVYTYIHTYIYTYIHTYIHTHIHMHIHIHTYIQMHGEISDVNNFCSLYS